MADDVDERFLCPICREVFKCPVTVHGCEHTFCAVCVSRSPSSADGSFPCPVCRAPFLHSQLKCNKSMERDITCTIVTCGTCGMKCKLSHWSEHGNSHYRPSLPQHHTSPPSPNRSTFKCPLCPQQHLSSSDLLTHVNTSHPCSQAAVVCPICASMPWGVTHQVSQNFVKHLNARHKFEYNTYVDFMEDEDVTLRAILQASITDK